MTGKPNRRAKRPSEATAPEPLSKREARDVAHALAPILGLPLTRQLPDGRMSKPRDPRKLRPADLLQAINSTPLGTVVTERQIFTHRMHAGLRIAGDPAGKTMDLLRYSAWLFDEARPPRPRPPTKTTVRSVTESPLEAVNSGAAYEAHKERARARQAEASQTGRDIGPIPAPRNWDRRNACAKNLKLFAETYFQRRFTLKPSKVHLEYWKILQNIILHGGLQAEALPRGSGKTTMIEVAAIWGVLNGYRRFIVPLGPEGRLARKMLRAFKIELESNELLLEDFPEACFPIRALQGIAQRTKGQLCEGERTNIEWKTDYIFLPTVKNCAWAKCSGAIIDCRSITGSVRGLTHVMHDGSVVRPDLVLADDIQTKASARSMLQCQTREEILHGDVLKMAGPDKTIACLVTVTVIRKGDLADRILDREARPQWQGVRVPMVIRFPGGQTDGLSGPAQKLWDEYANLRRNGLRDGDEGGAATQFYALNRQAMDAGAEVYWEDRYLDSEISAIQHAMNQLIDDPVSFWAECQQQPVETDGDAAGKALALTIKELEARAVGLKRGVVPLGCDHLVATIDVQQSCLWWMVFAAGEGFTGHICDYGVWPDQGLTYVTLKDVKQTLQLAMPGAELAAQIRGGLSALCTKMMAVGWLNEAGVRIPLERIVVDANYETDGVFAFCREAAPQAGGGLIIPSHGRGITASQKSLNEYDRKPGDRIGHHWRVPATSKRAIRYVVFDGNYWKSFIAQHFRTAIGERGAFTVFQHSRGSAGHRMLFEHLASEYPIRTSGRGRELDEWKLTPGRDNHLLDNLVNAVVAASMSGVTAVGHESKRGKVQKKAINLSDLQKQKRGTR